MTRHLHRTADTHTICGLGRSQCNSVHVSKARHSDCAFCRGTYRQELAYDYARARAAVGLQPHTPHTGPAADLADYYEARRLEEDADREAIAYADGTVKRSS